MTGQETEEELTRELDYMGVDADPNADCALPLEVHTHIASLLDVVALDTEYSQLAKEIKNKYKHVKNVPSCDDLAKDYARAQRQLRARR